MLMRVYGCRPFISLHLLPHCLLVCRFMHHAHFKAVYDALDGVCNVRHSLLSPATRDSLHRFLSGCRTVSADPVVSLIPSVPPHPPPPPLPPHPPTPRLSSISPPHSYCFLLISLSTASQIVTFLEEGFGEAGADSVHSDMASGDFGGASEASDNDVASNAPAAEELEDDDALEESDRAFEESGLFRSLFADIHEGTTSPSTKRKRAVSSSAPRARPYAGAGVAAAKANRFELKCNRCGFPKAVPKAAPEPAGDRAKNSKRDAFCAREGSKKCIRLAARSARGTSQAECVICGRAVASSKQGQRGTCQSTGSPQALTHIALFHHCPSTLPLRATRLRVCVF